MIAGRPSEGKVKVNLTLSPEFIKAARKLDPNLSRFVEAAGRLEIERQAKRKPRTRNMGA